MFLKQGEDPKRGFRPHARWHVNPPKKPNTSKNDVNTRPDTLVQVG